MFIPVLAEGGFALADSTIWAWNPMENACICFPFRQQLYSYWRLKSLYAFDNSFQNNWKTNTPSVSLGVKTGIISLLTEFLTVVVWFSSFLFENSWKWMALVGFIEERAPSSNDCISGELGYTLPSILFAVERMRYEVLLLECDGSTETWHWWPYYDDVLAGLLLDHG